MDPATVVASPRRWGALVFICLALLLISIDNTVLNVALPATARHFSATTSDLQWMVDAYPLLFSALLLTMGTLGDRVGRNRLLLVGVAWFATASCLAGFSHSSLMVIGTRGILGIGGATIIPQPAYQGVRESIQVLGIAAVVAFAFLPRDIQHVVEVKEATTEPALVPSVVGT